VSGPSPSQVGTGVPDEALGFVTAFLARGCAGIVAGDTLAEALWSARSGLDQSEPAQFAARCAFDAYGAT